MKGLLIPDESIAKSYLKTNGFSISAEHGEYKSFLSDSVKDMVFVVGGSGHKFGESAAWLVNNYSPDFLISIGYAMSLEPSVSIGDTVFCSKITALEGPMALWHRDSSSILQISSPMQFDDYGNTILNNVKAFSEGNLLSVNNVPSSLKMRYWIGEEFDSCVIDIWSSDISTTCLKLKIPFVLIRFIVMAADEKISVFDRRNLGELVNPTFSNYIIPSNIFAILKTRIRRKKAMHDFNQIISAVGSMPSKIIDP